MVQKIRNQRPLSKGEQLRFTIDCSEPVGDNIFDPSAFEKFLNGKMKVNGKTGSLGDKIIISRNGAIVSVTANVQMPKRYLKYLTKKYLHKESLKDWIHVVANAKESYKLSYYKINNDNQDDDEEEDMD